MSCRTVHDEACLSPRLIVWLRRLDIRLRRLGIWLRRLDIWLRRLGCLALLCALAACGGHTARRATQYNPSRYYPPPGSASDPWGPYIHEASGRYGVPEVWIRRVMRQESGGQEDVISWAGAMGLMQVMPDTYNGLRGRYSELGDDPFDPHNNILAGTAYLREMYDRYGSPGFLAAYNAGPNRLDRYLSHGTPLPDETVNYVASIAPLLGPGTPMSGPLAVYAGAAGSARVVASRRSSDGCDMDAAYNPDGPCSPAEPSSQRVALVAPTPAGCDQDVAFDPAHPCQPMQPIAQAVAPPTNAPPTNARMADCDPDAAYDPMRRCRSVPAAEAPVVAETPPPAVAETSPSSQMQPSPRVVAQTALPAPSAQSAYRARRPIQEATAPVVSFSPRAAIPGVAIAGAAIPSAAIAGAAAGAWAIQVGAYANLATAQAAAEKARNAAPELLRMAKTELPATTPFGSQIAFRARLAGLTPAIAADACVRLSGRGMPCMTVPPGHTS